MRKERQKFVDVKEGRKRNKTREGVTTEERSHRFIRRDNTDIQGRKVGNGIRHRKKVLTFLKIIILFLLRNLSYTVFMIVICEHGFPFLLNSLRVGSNLV